MKYICIYTDISGLSISIFLYATHYNDNVQLECLLSSGHWSSCFQHFCRMMLLFVVSLQRLASNIECAFLKGGRVILKVTALNKRPTQYLKSHAESESISLEVSHLRIYQQPSNKLSTFGKKVRILGVIFTRPILPDGPTQLFGVRVFRN